MYIATTVPLPGVLFISDLPFKNSTLDCIFFKPVP